MKTQVADTSIEAFYGIQSKLNNKEKELLRALTHIQPASDRELSKYLGWEIGSVNGRRNSLVGKKVIEPAFTNVSSTGRRVMYWRVMGDFVKNEYRGHGDGHIYNMDTVSPEDIKLEQVSFL